MSGKIQQNTGKNCSRRWVVFLSRKHVGRLRTGKLLEFIIPSLMDIITATYSIRVSHLREMVNIDLNTTALETTLRVFHVMMDTWAEVRELTGEWRCCYGDGAGDRESMGIDLSAWGTRVAVAWMIGIDIMVDLAEVSPKIEDKSTHEDRGQYRDPSRHNGEHPKLPAKPQSKDIHRN